MGQYTETWWDLVLEAMGTETSEFDDGAWVMVSEGEERVPGGTTLIEGRNYSWESPAGIPKLSVCRAADVGEWLQRYAPWEGVPQVWIRTARVPAGPALRAKPSPCFPTRRDVEYVDLGPRTPVQEWLKATFDSWKLTRLVSAHPHILRFIDSSAQSGTMCEYACRLDLNRYADPSALRWVHNQDTELCKNVLLTAPHALPHIRDLTRLGEYDWIIIIRRHPTLLTHVPTHTPAILHAAIDADWRTLALITPQTTDVSERAISINLDALALVRDQSFGVCAAALRRHVRAMAHIRDQRSAMMTSLLQEFPLALEYVRDPTEEQCCIAVRANPHALRFVCERKQTLAICTAAVRASPHAIQYVVAQTPELCLAAVCADPTAIAGVRAPTLEMATIAARANPWLVTSIQARTPAVTMAAVCANWKVLERVPPDEQTDALCIAALQQDVRALTHVAHQTPAVCVAAVRLWRDALRHIHAQTHEVCMAAVQAHSDALQYVHAQTHEVCMAAVQAHNNTLQYVRVQTPAVCAAAVARDPFALQHVEAQTHELCVTAASRDARVLAHVQRHLLTEPLFAAVLAAHSGMERGDATVSAAVAAAVAAARARACRPRAEPPPLPNDASTQEWHAAPHGTSPRNARTDTQTPLRVH